MATSSSSRPVKAKPGANPFQWDNDAERHQQSPVYNPRVNLPLHQQRVKLPIHKHRLSILHALETHQAVVVCGAAGCGKSTQLPQYLDEAGWTADGYVIGVTMPRRVAAVSVAARVAQEMDSKLGAAVGYKIRFDNQFAPGETRIVFMTEGMMLREMLSRYSVIMVDEAHERSVDSDLLLGLLKKILRKRARLRLIVASATLEVDAFLKFLSRSGGEKAPQQLPPRKRPRCGWDDETGEFHQQRAEEGDWRQLCKEMGAGDATALKDVCLSTIEGQLHTVKIHYLEEPAGDYIESAVGTTLAIHEGQPEGDVLLFLTGREEIDTACSLLKERLAETRERRGPKGKRIPPLQVVPLHSGLPQAAQLKAFVQAPRGTRKVVVSTNIAEASVTIDGIVYVVDACLVKLQAFCPYNGVTYLNVAACSRSAAKQRSGRAGRTRPGLCYRLLTEEAFTSGLNPHTMPELCRCDLKDAVLLLKCLGVDDISAFQFVTAPTVAALELALEDLYALGAIDSDARVLEPVGPRMSLGPLPLNLMRFLLLSTEAPHSCAEEAATICAMLSLKPPWLPGQNADRLRACQQSFAVYEGDLVALLNILRQYENYRTDDPEWAERHLLNADLLERAMQVQGQLLHFLAGLDLPIESCRGDVLRLQRLSCAALFANAARRLPNGSYRLLRPVDSTRAPQSLFALHPSSVLASTSGHAPAAFIVFSEALSTAGEAAYLINNIRIQPSWLAELAPHYFQQVAAAKAVLDA